MAVKDGVFIVSFFASYLLGLFYIMAFTSTYWTSYTLYIGGHKEIGSIGLWKKCSTNETSGVESCTSSRLAQGPCKYYLYIYLYIYIYIYMCVCVCVCV